MNDWFGLAECQWFGWKRSSYRKGNALSCPPMNVVLGSLNTRSISFSSACFHFMILENKLNDYIHIHEGMRNCNECWRWSKNQFSLFRSKINFCHIVNYFIDIGCILFYSTLKKKKVRLVFFLFWNSEFLR